jgi:predicted small lipoprotein YifL
VALLISPRDAAARRRRWRASIAVAVLLAALAGCGGPRVVPLSEFVANPDYYDGREVVAHGVVLEFGDDDGPVEHHYVIQDSDVNRVQLLPNEAAEPHVGSVVEVAGEFEFDPDRGRLLHVERIESVGAGR